MTPLAEPTLRTFNPQGASPLEAKALAVEVAFEGIRVLAGKSDQFQPLSALGTNINSLVLMEQRFANAYSLGLQFVKDPEDLVNAKRHLTCAQAAVLNLVVEVGAIGLGDSTQLQRDLVGLLESHGSRHLKQAEICPSVRAATDAAKKEISIFLEEPHAKEILEQVAIYHKALADYCTASYKDLATGYVANLQPDHPTNKQRAVELLVAVIREKSDPFFQVYEQDLPKKSVSLAELGTD